MHAARKQVDSTSPTRGWTNSSAPDGLEPLIASVQQLASPRQRSWLALRGSKRLPNRDLSVSKTMSRTQPTTPDRDGSWTIDDLRATLIARAEEEEKRGFRLARLILHKLLRPVTVICVSVLALSIAGTALVLNLPNERKAEIIAVLLSKVTLNKKGAELIAALPAVAPKPAITPAEAPIQAPATAGASVEPVKPIQSATSAAPTNTLSAEEVKLLISRGDALVAMSDLGSARLFYERAVAAGDAQAALKLGATYDPSFLSQAGLIRFVRADLAAAAHWYERARDLGAVEQAEILLKGISRN